NNPIHFAVLSSFRDPDPPVVGRPGGPGMFLARSDVPGAPAPAARAEPGLRPGMGFGPQLPRRPTRLHAPGNRLPRPPCLPPTHTRRPASPLLSGSQRPSADGRPARPAAGCSRLSRRLPRLELVVPCALGP